ncbi:hypothetical protein [Patulibacter defluvii]|uniref:hypothetical protein n=1 Tax=Patulibacter defluvii TaxID=3095358 RepID=UPI002A7610C6|nr:hypothetical protein [Patulibacter sp. DM4]
MPAIRLIILATVVIGVLAVVGAMAPPVQRDGRDRPVGQPPSASRAPAGPAGEVVRIRTPAREPVAAAVGDTIELRVELPEFDRIVVPALGVEEEVSPDVPTTIRFPAVRRGSFRVRLQLARRTLVRIDVGGDGPRSRPAPSPVTPRDGSQPTPASVLPIG